ncbi:MAG TPA: tetratricopeptide repeat protein [Anaerolineae bacterium]|nr:tetratricopeptide repeat protein [Anaerolineae bacterium]
MYLNRPPQRRSSPRRILIYLALIAAGLLFLRFQDDLRRPLLPTPTATRAAQSYVAEAQALYEAGRLAASVDAYTQAIALEPNRVDVLVTLSRVLALADRTAEAVQRAERAVQLDPQSAQAHAALAMAYDWHGAWLLLHGRDTEANEHYHKAVSSAQEAILLDPAYAEAHAYLAEAYMDQSQLVNAIEAAQAAVELDPQQSDVQRAVGYVRESQGNYLGAVEAYREALRHDPSVPYLWLTLGRNYRILASTADAGYLDDAVNAFKEAIQLDPNYGPAYDELGWTYHNVQDESQAIEALEQAIEVDPNSWSAHNHLGIAYYSNRNYEGAAGVLPRAIELMNETFDADRYCVNATSRACDRLVEAYYILGLTDYYLCNCEESYTLFDKALVLRPEEPIALEGIRLCREESSDICEATQEATATPTP